MENILLKCIKKKIRHLKEYTSEQDSIIMEKEDTISRIERIHKEMMAKMDKQNEDANKRHQDAMTKMDRQSEEMKVMQKTLDKIVKKLDDRAVPPSDTDLTERFVLMKKDNNTFYVIRSQERRMSKAIVEKERLGYTKVPYLLESELIPNSIYLWNCVKDELIRERKIKCKYNEISLRNMSETDLVSIIKQVFDSRRDTN